MKIKDQNEYRWEGQKVVLRPVEKQEKNLYNDFIRNHRYGNVFQSYEWGELKGRHGWLPLRLVLEVEGRIRGAVSLLKKENPWFRLVYSPRGPVVDFGDRECVRVFTSAMENYLRHRGMAFWKMDPEVSRKERIAFPPGEGFFCSSTASAFGGIQPRSVWRLDLGGGHYPLETRSKAVRRQIKRAQKSGVVIREGRREDVPAFYEILRETATRNNFRIRSLSYYQDMWDILHPSGFLYFFLGTLEGRIICGALAASFGRGIWDMYAGTGERARQTGASYLLTWKMIKGALDQGFSFYDLGGVPVSEDSESSLEGLCRFKSRFGGERFEFIGEYDYVLSLLPYRLWSLIMGARNRLLKDTAAILKK